MLAARQKDRTIGWLRRGDPVERDTFHITESGKRTEYAVEAFPTDYGRGFAVHVLTSERSGTVYHICLDGKESTCSCPGQEAWGHLHPCRHLVALTTLLGE